MTATVRKQFKLYPHNRTGTWESNYVRYRAYAHELLVQLDQLCIDVQSKWPDEAATLITNESLYPDLWKLVQIRNRTSDNVRIYAAIAVEGFLNFYGVLRLGQDVYDEHFERLGIIPKLRKLMLICDGLNIPNNDQLCIDINLVAQSRNELVHPKTKEVEGDTSMHKRSSTSIPNKARNSVVAMEAFFSGLLEAVPDLSTQLQRIEK